jgi:serine/threonine-protein phosphatase 4 regulatory subunit 1
MVGGPARYAVVEVLSRMRKADEWEDRDRNLAEDQDSYPSGLFGRNERKMFQDEILQQVVIGMGKLDAGAEEQEEEEQANESTSRTDVVNPYFPILPSNPTASSSAQSTPTAATLAAPPTAGGKADSSPVLHVSFAQLPAAPSGQAVLWPDDALDSPTTKHNRASKTEIEYHVDADEMDHGAGMEGDIDEQAAVGRLSSMSLMAAVTASGVLVFLCRRQISY